MDLVEFAGRELPGAGELSKMMGSGLVGASLGRLAAAPFDSREFRRLANMYAGSAEGPFGKARIELYHQIHDLFEALRALPGNEGLKGYELKDSFLGGEEADLAMLIASHEGMSQEALAHDVLYCSKNAVGERRARMKEGIRIGGMCIQAEFGYRGEFRSSVHPVSLPLNLSDVYVLFDALSEYAAARDARDPHRRAAERIAGMVKSQLSGYAKGRLAARLEESGFDKIPELDPVFAPDAPARAEAGRHAGESGCRDGMEWLYYVKAGVPVCVEDSNGVCVEGVVLPAGVAARMLSERGIARKDARPCCSVLLPDGDIKTIPWADVADVRKP